MMASNAPRADAHVVRHTSKQFDGAAGELLLLHSWLPADDPAAVVAVVHGYGEHGGRHQRLAAALAPQGNAVYAYDLRGHGLSTGERGQVYRFDDYLEDTARFLELVRAAQPGRPLFLLGHSLGGLIAATFAIRHPDGLGGLVLSSPFLRLVMEVPLSKRVAAQLLSVAMPGFNIGNTLQAADLSHDQTVVDAYVTDPLVHHVAPARWATQMLGAQSAALAAAPSLTLPLLLLFSDTDTIADPAASREFFAAAGSEDKTSHCYEGLYHELFNESDNEAVFADLVAWLKGHGPEAAAPAGPA